MEHTVFLVSAVVLGACVGSFLNVVIFRLPAGTFFKGGYRSHCPKCEAPIAWYDNIPVFSWVVLLRGKGRCCGNPIRIRYPLVEVLTAVLMGYLFWHVMPDRAALQVGSNWVQLGFYTWFVAMLIACTFIDIDLRILPDLLTKPTIVIGLVGAGLQMAPWYTFDPPDRFQSLLLGGAGAVTGYWLTKIIQITATKVFAKPAMGKGDVKFMGAVGAFVGWDGAIVAFFIGCVSGAVYGVLHMWIKKEKEIFFGPFLALGGLLTLFFKARILEFLTVTWPQWQASMQLPPWVLLIVAAICLVLLFLLIRNARR